MSDRTVHTDALATLGEIITPAEKRDAVHIAALPVCAGEVLERGDHVYLRKEVAFKARTPFTNNIDNAVGIVDPFLRVQVREGEWFWLLIYPRVITSLRHVWSHPLISNELRLGALPPATPSESEQWVRNWCDRVGEIDYDDLIEVSKTGMVKSTMRGDEYYGGVRWSLRGGSLTSHGSDASGEIPEELWKHIANIIGREPVSTAEWFNCSC